MRIDKGATTMTKIDAFVADLVIRAAICLALMIIAVFILMRRVR